MRSGACCDGCLRAAADAQTAAFVRFACTIDLDEGFAAPRAEARPRIGATNCGASHRSNLLVARGALT